MPVEDGRPGLSAGWPGAAAGGISGPVVFLGEVVQRDAVQEWFGDAFAAVADGFDSRLADEAGEAADPSGGSFVQVGGLFRQAAVSMSVQVEGLLEGGDQVAEWFVAAGAGGQCCAVDEGGATGQLGPAHAAEHGAGGDVDARVDERGGDAFGEVSEPVGGLGTAGSAGVEPVDLVDQLDSGCGAGVADGTGDLRWSCAW